jgi:hypothetical protein
MTDGTVQGDGGVVFTSGAHRVDVLTRRITAADGGTLNLWGVREIVWDEGFGLRVIFSHSGGFDHQPRPRIIDATGYVPPRRPKPPTLWQSIRAWFAGQTPPNEGSEG